MFHKAPVHWNNALESLVVGWFANRGALWRILAWAFIGFVAMLAWSTGYEQQVLEDARTAREQRFSDAMGDRDARRYRLTEASQERLAANPDADFFRIVIVGASENFLVETEGEKTRMDLAEGLATELEHLLSSVEGVRPQIVDASYPGTRFEDRYLLVDYATQLDPDLILITTDFRNLMRVISSEAAQVSALEVDTDSSFLSNSLYSAVAALADGPARTIDKALNANISSYASRFRYSFRPLVFGPVRIEFEGAMAGAPFDLELKGIELDHFAGQRIAVNTTVRSAGFAESDLQRLFANDLPNIETVLEIVSRPAVAQHIPAQFVITPTPEYFDADSETEYEWIESAIAAFEDENRQAGNMVRAWNSGPERLVQRKDFVDIMHFSDFRPLARRLLEILIENEMVPKEWSEP